MSSQNFAEPLDLERGLPVTAADVQALRAKPRAMSGQEYLKWLAKLPQPTQEELRKRNGPALGPPFQL